MNKGSNFLKAAGIMAIVLGAITCIGYLSIVTVLTGISLIYGGLDFLKYADIICPHGLCL